MGFSAQSSMRATVKTSATKSSPMPSGPSARISTTTRTAKRRTSCGTTGRMERKFRTWMVGFPPRWVPGRASSGASTCSPAQKSRSQGTTMSLNNGSPRTPSGSFVSSARATATSAHTPTATFSAGRRIRATTSRGTSGDASTRCGRCLRSPASAASRSLSRWWPAWPTR